MSPALTAASKNYGLQNRSLLMTAIWNRRQRKHPTFLGKWDVFQRVKKLFLTRWQAVKKVRKTSKPHPSAYIGTVGCVLRRKSKTLRSKLFSRTSYSVPVPHGIPVFGVGKLHNAILFLTITDFIDSLMRCPSEEEHRIG